MRKALLFLLSVSPAPGLVSLPILRTLLGRRLVQGVVVAFDNQLRHASRHRRLLLHVNFQSSTRLHPNRALCHASLTDESFGQDTTSSSSRSRSFTNHSVASVMHQSLA